LLAFGTCVFSFEIEKNLYFLRKAECGDWPLKPGAGIRFFDGMCRKPWTAADT
jgi:hypothetical protein